MVKRRGTQWQVDFRWENQRIRRSFNDEAAALAWEATARSRLNRGLPLDEVVRGANGTTLDELVESTRARYWSGTASAQGATSNAEQVAEILGGNRHPADITTSDVDNLIAELTKLGNSNATINRKLAALGKMMSHALSRGIIDKKPLIERKRESQGRVRWYTNEEEAKILAAASAVSSDFADIVLFLIDTGARLGDAWRVEWVDVDDRFVRLNRTKNGRSRGVPLTDRVKAMLASRRKTKTDSFVFPGWTNSKAAKAWDRVRKAAGLTDDEAVLHALRHTCASRLAQAGVPIQVVQQWLGHKTLSMTMRYSHMAPANLLAAATVLNRPPVASVQAVG